MYSGTRGLGFPQNIMTTDEWYDMSQGPGDLDLISVAYLSPDAGYPPERYTLFDQELEQHQTLNGLAAGAQERFIRAMGPKIRFFQPGYQGNRPAKGVRPRSAPKPRTPISRLLSPFFGGIMRHPHNRYNISK